MIDSALPKLLTVTLATLALSTAACSGASDARPTDGGAAADAFDALDAFDAPPPSLAWSPCFETFECATLDAPRGDPGGPAIEIAVIRHRAAASASRLGVLLFNPGGPGNAAVGGFPQTYASLSTLLGADVLDRFDVITFDWRGLGRSRPSIVCGDDATLDALASVDLASSRPHPPELDAAVAGFIAACSAGTDAAFLARIDSESVARDMDLLRAALGEEKIHYLGISYGTWLGATYASLFPDRVGAFVLDSPVAPHADRREFVRDLARGVEDALPEFFAWCDAAGSPCKLAADVGTTTTAEAFDEVIARLESAPAPAGARKLTALLAMRATRTLLMGARWGELWYGLDLAWKGDGARLFAGAGLGRDGAGHYDGSFAAGFAINAVEVNYPEGYTDADYFAFRAEVAAEFPRAGWSASSFDVVNLRWPVKRAEASHPIGAKGAPPLLLLGGKHDPATSFDQTLRLQKALDNGSYVVVAEGQGHYQMSQNACAASAAAAFLVDPTRAPAVTRCASTFP